MAATDDRTSEEIQDPNRSIAHLRLEIYFHNRTSDHTRNPPDYAREINLRCARRSAWTLTRKISRKTTCPATLDSLVLGTWFLRGCQRVSPYMHKCTSGSHPVHSLRGEQKCSTQALIGSAEKGLSMLLYAASTQLPLLRPSPMLVPNWNTY